MGEPIETVTVLRDRDGAPLHAVLDWEAYQALLRATRPGLLSQEEAGIVARAARRLGTEVVAEVPAAVLASEQSGIHPVRAWREFRGYNQAQFAALVGISRAYLAQIETGERIGTLEVMAKLARSLSCLIEDLMRDSPDAFAASVAGLARMPGELRKIIDAVPGRLWRKRPAEDSFSLVEHVCHLRDIDRDGYYVRIARMLSEEDPLLHDIDGAALAQERRYQRQDLEAAFAAFAATRREITERLVRLGPAECKRAGLMDGTRRITIEDLVAAMTAHDSSHLQELADLRGTLA